jgi:CDP-glycerol glycerophosphotransferase (TagB/SpsB family)
MAHAGSGRDAWEFDERALDLLANTLYHADVVITMYSTFFIEGALADKPLIGIAYDGGRKTDFAQSAARFFEWDHLAQIRPLDGIRLVHSDGELADAVREGLEHPAARAENRKKIVRQQCQYTDGMSGARTARVLLDMLE